MPIYFVQLIRCEIPSECTLILWGSEVFNTFCALSASLSFYGCCWEPHLVQGIPQGIPLTVVLKYYRAYYRTSDVYMLTSEEALN